MQKQHTCINMLIRQKLCQSQHNSTQRNKEAHHSFSLDKQHAWLRAMRSMLCALLAEAARRCSGQQQEYGSMHSFLIVATQMRSKVMQVNAIGKLSLCRDSHSRPDATACHIPDPRTGPSVIASRHLAACAHACHKHLS